MFWFECWHISTPECRRRIAAASRGKAKSSYRSFYLDVDADCEFCDIRSKLVGPIESTEIVDPDFQRTAEYRGVPFARLGMRITVAGDPGRIVGKNSSANFDVMFDGGPHSGLVLNCHPNWQTRYFDARGELLADFVKAANA